MTAEGANREAPPAYTESDDENANDDNRDGERSLSPPDADGDAYERSVGDGDDNFAQPEDES